MLKEHILVVEDEDDIQELVEYNLAREGYRVTCVGSGEEALKVARAQIPDLVVLDLMLPGRDGLEVCKTLRADERTARIPILMLTAKSEESDVVLGLEVGADDYLAKPFSPRVLVARAKAALRRTTTAVAEKGAGQTLKVHEIVIEPGRHAVRIEGEPIDLTLTEFRILHLLARRPGWVHSRDQIIEAIRGEDYPVTPRSVDVHIAGLRKKLGSQGKYLTTVRGVGYRFEE
ncbi:MAG: response regulator transcription factor [Candidatus Eisenbacteria bacterium]|nr:response regulator transcription factor [Candidatus Eisenbacteria bacterium]MCC7142627.1 response regulator transcription factor [Candidatus Eisenbacteria bacterium]